MGIAAKTPDLALITPVEYLVDAIDFNGTNSDIIYANNLFSDIDLDYEATGTHTKSMTMSLWIKPDLGANNTGAHVFRIDDSGGQQSRLLLTSDASEFVRAVFFHSYNSTNRNSFFIGWATAYGDLNRYIWNHIVFSTKVELSSGSETWTHRLRINGVDKDSYVTNDSTFDGTIDTTANSYFGRDPLGLNRYTGCLTEFFLDDNFYDLDSVSQVRKFLSVDGKPVNPPSSKLVHLTGSSSTWTNKGTTALGTQTLNNITDCADSPSD